MNRQEGSLEPLATVIGDTIGEERGTGALLLGVAKTFNYSKDSSESKTALAAKAIRAALVAGSDYIVSPLAHHWRGPSRSRNSSVV
ncbi:hypothetical protein [Candidatus Synechococcus spongiarum]|uniref:hypothetical protein n=1 Tax=Candidatus Synechococcus spongiarum TaxID=431041 RepID=UPI0004BCC7F5|nr:hypothetical protein [Candidatus Synechococcus spongiarum]